VEIKNYWIVRLGEKGTPHNNLIRTPGRKTSLESCTRRMEDDIQIHLIVVQIYLA
jgi:hypothetical protein